MIHWQETALILERVEQSVGQGLALATVVQIDGSAYRRPGAKLLVQSSGGSLGGVSGGCLESDVCTIGLASIRDRSASLKHYDTGSDENVVWGLGLGCDGAVDVFIQPLDEEYVTRVVAPVRRLLRGDAPFAIATVIAGVGVGQSVVCTEGGTPTGSVTDPSLRDTLVRLGLECLERRESILETVSGTRVFAEFLDPPPWLAVIGAGDDAIPLARFAADVGFRVAVIDHRQAFLETHRFPDAKHRICARPDDAVSDVELDRAYAVIMTHSLNLDTGWVERLVGTAAPYIGLLGPRTRTARILAGVDGGSRVYGPVGLDLGADGPEQVAVSVLAEVLAVRAGREPRHLRERTEAIHVS